MGLFPTFVFLRNGHPRRRTNRFPDHHSERSAVKMGDLGRFQASGLTPPGYFIISEPKPTVGVFFTQVFNPMRGKVNQQKEPAGAQNPASFDQHGSGIVGISQAS